MITNHGIFLRGNWAKEGRIVVHRLPKRRRTMSSSKDEGPSKRREPRSGPRKVSSLSAAQLERKRANDREAQRSIRQRTKDHIEHLETQVAVLQAQVAQMRPRSEQFDELLRQNTALQHEVSRLKHQLATLTGRPGFAGSGEQVAPYRSGWHMEEGPANAPSSIPTTNAMLSSFPGPSHPPSNLRRAPSAVSTSSRSSHPHDWPQPQDSMTRSPSLGETPEPEYAAQIKYAPYVIDGQLQQVACLVQPSIPVAASQLKFGSTGSASQQPSESSFAQIFPHAGGLHSPSQSSLAQPTPHLLPGQRSAAGTVPSASAPSQPNPAQPYQQSAPPFQNTLARPSQRDPNDPYPWVPQS